MRNLKVWIRAARVKSRRMGRKLLYKRKVRQVLYWLHNFSFPGHKGVPIYYVLSYFFVSAFNSSLTDRAKGLAYSFIAALPPLMIFFFSLIAYFPVDGGSHKQHYQRHHGT